MSQSFCFLLFSLILIVLLLLLLSLSSLLPLLLLILFSLLLYNCLFIDWICLLICYYPFNFLDFSFFLLIICVLGKHFKIFYINILFSKELVVLFHFGYATQGLSCLRVKYLKEINSKFLELL